MINKNTLHHFDRLSRLEDFFSRYNDVLLKRLLVGMEEIISIRFEVGKVGFLCLESSGAQVFRKFPFRGLANFFSRTVGVDINVLEAALDPLGALESEVKSLTVLHDCRYGKNTYEVESVSFCSGGCELVVRLGEKNRIIDFVDKKVLVVM